MVMQLSKEYLEAVVKVRGEAMQYQKWFEESNELLLELHHHFHDGNNDANVLEEFVDTLIMAWHLAWVFEYDSVESWIKCSNPVGLEPIFRLSVLLSHYLERGDAVSACNIQRAIADVIVSCDRGLKKYDEAAKIMLETKVDKITKKFGVVYAQPA